MDGNTVAIWAAGISAGGFLLNIVVSIIKGTKSLDTIVEKKISEYDKNVVDLKLKAMTDVSDQKFIASSNEVEQCIDKQILIEKELNGPGSITQMVGILETRASAFERRLERVEDKT